MLHVPRIGRAAGNRRSMFAICPFNSLDLLHKDFENHQAGVASDASSIFINQ